MQDYVVISDATLDLPREVIEDLEIAVVPMKFLLNDHEYIHYPDERELSVSEFYTRLRGGEMSVSSQINPDAYMSFFRPFLEEGKDIIYIGLSGGLSGTVQSSQMAAQILLEEYPNARITCMDSICASVGEGLITYLAAIKRREGVGYEELVVWIMEHRLKIEHWFTVEDLFHLKRGGRLSAVGAVLGTALNIKPVLSVDRQGKLYVKEKVRGMKKGMDFQINRLKTMGVDTSSQTVVIGHADSPEAAELLKDRLMKEELVKDVIISTIGPIIGTHVGPGMLALTFLGKGREQ